MIRVTWSAVVAVFLEIAIQLIILILVIGIYAEVKAIHHQTNEIICEAIKMGE